MLSILAATAAMSFFLSRTDSQIKHEAPKTPGNLKVGYWKIRGLGAPLRMMCEYVGAQYESSEYAVTGEPGKWDFNAWFGVKPEFLKKNPLANLPYVLDGDVLVTQSNACYLYLGKKFKLMGKDEAEVTKMEQVLFEVFDLRNNVLILFYGNSQKSDFEKYLDGSAKSSLTKLENWFNFYKTTYSASSDRPTVADFHLWEMLDQHELLSKDIKGESLLDSLSKFPLLRQFYLNFRALPTLQKYFQSATYKLPVNNTMAAWGNK